MSPQSEEEHENTKKGLFQLFLFIIGIAIGVAGCEKRVYAPEELERIEQFKEKWATFCREDPQHCRNALIRTETGTLLRVTGVTDQTASISPSTIETQIIFGNAYFTMILPNEDGYEYAVFEWIDSL